MQIIELQAENVKRIKAIKITPKDNVVVLEGKNAQGKSSALDCIAYALGGKKLIPDNPIRDGQETAFVKIDLGEYQVTRTWTKKNTYLKIENKDGFKSSNPQIMLDLLIGDLSFDPMAFCNLDKAKRIDILKNICGLNFDDLKIQYEKNYSERTQINRNIDSLQEQLKNYEALEPLCVVRDIKEVEKERDEIDKYNKDIDIAINHSNVCDSTIKSLEERINKLNIEMNYYKEQKEMSLKTAMLPKKDNSKLTSEVVEITKQQYLTKSHNIKTKLENDLMEQRVKCDACEIAIHNIKAEK